MRTLRRVATGLLVCVVCTAMSLLAMVAGIAVFGKDDVTSGCATRVTPSVGGPYYENTEILLAERTWFPLGAVCVLDSPDDRVGPQTVLVQSWPATVVWLAAAVGALRGVAIAVLAVLPPGRAGTRVSARSSAGGS